MNYLYIFLIFLSVFFPQSIFNRIIVPIYIESEFSYGHDDNYLKLSLPEQENDLEYRLGDSERIYSDIIKNKINIMYSPYINHHHETRVDFTITTSKYESSDLKSYNNYFLKLSQKHVYNLDLYQWQF